MRKFPRKAAAVASAPFLAARPESVEGSASPLPSSVRLAVYDAPGTAPQVMELTGDDYRSFIGELAAKTYDISRAKGGQVPFVVINELVENLLHAYFQDAVISVFDDGNSIRISDHGPGIKEKEKAFLPGFSTADAELKRYIKGVGSGLSVVKETLELLGGVITVEDNLTRGTVITLSLQPSGSEVPRGRRERKTSRSGSRVQLTDRQKKVLLLLVELGSAGPSTVARELSISASTAHRDMSSLEQIGLLRSDESGKRSLTEEGLSQIDLILT